MVFKSVTRCLAPRRLFTSVALPAVLGVAAALAPEATVASTFKTVASFCSDYPQCTDGLSPNSIAIGPTGSLFGTTYAGGDVGNAGIVFELGQKGRVHVLYRFCKTDCSDGLNPRGIIADVNGNLYGTTQSGGANGYGAIFKLARDAASGKWQLRLLHSFCSRSGCRDGSKPLSGLSYKGQANGALYDGVSPLFGTTSEGGANGKGTIFRLSVVNGAPRYRAMYHFCSQANCADGDGAYTFNPPFVESNHQLFGAARGGATGNGIVYSLAQSGGTYAETVLYTFCQSAGCPDGAFPNGVVRNSTGELVGTTEAGGAQNGGTVFKILPNGTASPETVLYSFCSASNCVDGRDPSGQLMVGLGGALFGTTAFGGASSYPGGWTVFRIDGETETVLHSMCSDQACTDGSEPGPNLIWNGSAFIGTTYSGGAGSGLGGTVFRLKP